MNTVTHSYGADLDWVDSYASQLNGKVEGNFIRVPESISTGTRYFLDTGDDAVILYIDAVYHNKTHFIQSHIKKDFIGFYCDLTDSGTTNTGTNFPFDIGRLGYNLYIIDSLLEAEYFVDEQTNVFGVFIFIKKFKIEAFAKKHNLFSKNIEKIMDPDKNTFIKFDRMTPESYQTLLNLKKLDIGGEVFNLELMSAMYLLVSNFLNQMIHNTITIEKVNKDDLSAIISIQDYLINNIEKPFPSIKILARKAYMSESKFKSLFNKITGTTPNSFFISNKLFKAKELLQEQFSINEVCDKLNFTNYSYFIFKFRDHFGLSPYTFIKKL